MPWLPVAFGVVVLAGLTYSLIRVRRRDEKNFKIASWVRDQPTTYRTRAFVRQHRDHAWVDWNHNLGGGPQLIVHGHGIEVSAPQGMLLESREIFLDARAATMWVEQVGWGGTPLNRKKCIRLVGGTPQDAEIDIAVSPDTDFDATWQALIDAGVRPRTPAT